MKKNLLLFLLGITSYTTYAQSYTLTRGLPLTEISGTGTAIMGLGYNNSVGPFNIGFSFPFFENNYTQFYLAANGHLSFGNNNAGLVNAIPESSAPNNIIAFAAIAWNATRGTPTLNYFTTGTAPNRVLVINFKNVQNSFSDTPGVLQLQLYETSGKIEVHYTSFSAGPYWKATIGLENSAGSLGITNKDLNNKNSLTLNNEAIRFERVTQCSGTVSVSTSSNILCQGSSTLTASVLPSGVYTYQWFKNAVAIAGATNITYTAIEEGTYFVRITGDNNCIKQSTDVILVNSLTATLNKDTSYVCNGISVITSVSGNYTYQWYKDDIAIPGETSTSVTAQTIGIYKVAVNTGNCTVFSNNTQVVTNTISAYSLNINQCNNADLGVNLSSKPNGVTYSWSGPNGFISTESIACIYKVNTSHAGTYTVSVNFGCGDIQTDTSELTVFPISLKVSNNSTFFNCPDRTAQLGVNWDSNASFNPTYSWTGPNNFTSSERNPSFPLTSENIGVYTITVNFGSCGISTATTSIAMNTPVFYASSSPGLMLCETSSIELYTLLNNSSTEDIPGPTITSYSWVGPNNFTSNLRNPTINNLTTADAGFYTVTVSLSNGCTGTYTSMVGVNVTKNPGLTTRYLAGIRCEGYQAIIAPNANPLANTAVNYVWTGPNGFTSTQVSPTVELTSSGGLYTLTTTFTGGCTGTYTSFLSIPGMEKPELYVNNNLSVCIGKQLKLSISNLTVNNNLVFNWKGPNNFSSTQAQPEVSANATAAMAGVYTLTVIDVSGACPAPFIATVSVSVTECRPCNLTASNGSSNFYTCPGSTVSLFCNLTLPTYYNAPSYYWTGPNGFTSAERDPQINNVTAPGVYTVTATSYECDGAYTATTFVSVNTDTSTPSLLFSTNSFCEGNLLIFTPTTDIASSILYYSVTGPNGYSYYYSPPYTPPFGYNGPINALADMSGTYTVNAIYKKICANTVYENSVSSNVTINSRPSSPTVSGLPTTIEAGEATTLTANGCGVGTILWNNGSSINPLVVSPLASTDYWAICSSNGCTSTSSNLVTITLDSCPEQFILVNPTQNYSSGSILKHAKLSNGNITATNLVTGNANVTYQAKSILLNAGFKADNGTIFKAEVGGCN